MAEKRRRRKPMSDINVVPYIDVMLVLLVIFMVTAPMLTQGIKVDLPDANTEPLAVKPDEEPIIVSVDKDGKYYLNTGKTPGKPQALQVIQQQVQKMLKANPGLAVLVEGDQRVPYGLVVSLMGQLQVAGVANVGLVTESLDRAR